MGNRVVSGWSCSYLDSYSVAGDPLSLSKLIRRPRLKEYETPPLLWRLFAQEGLAWAT